MQEKFIETIELDDWEVMSHDGYDSIQAIGKTVEYEEYRVICTSAPQNQYVLYCADDHLVYCMWREGDAYAYGCVPVKDIVPLKHLIRVDDNTKWAIVNSVEKTGKKHHMYDLQVDSDNHLYFTNGILSHNSIWLGDIGAGVSMLGGNVFIASLEMKAEKIIKRIGSNRINIPMDNYVDVEIPLVKKQMERYIAGIKHGRLDVKQFASASMTDIAIYIHLYEEKMGIKYDMVIIDYLNELDSDDGLSMENMYSYHKANAKHMVRVGIENNWAMLSAMQLKVKAYDLDDISLSDGGESSGVAHRIDAAFGIIQTETMHDERIYKLKALKTRDSGFKNSTGVFSIDYSKMHLKDLEEIVGDFGMSI